ncbi:hypothetical protein GUITHDRAFT_100738 [Guillardia theta CCMP2712]|uniref:Uncharacterized protein n=2 Tax=Guillardia theta TaxID=55529 RepID=L1K094_GUITC|nr:hypothetical protein GUITHDRAFT_100738 [Guillardia theta CCMP2712]EKX53768.1 hypothetical protein GUITHDRAFT_100738 [Guillardia theta CCMP2712]|eukprot:XP_005840748.1 hypothetical protein GUITHDRAFT_100738 [Guillardia theta CCMP2712]
MLSAMPVQESSEKQEEPTRGNHGNISFQASAISAFLVLFSFMLVLLGVEYANLYSSHDNLSNYKGSGVVYPPVVLLISGLCMLCMGLGGLTLGITAVLLNVKSKGFTIFVLSLQGVFGIFTLAAMMFGTWAFEAKLYSSNPSVVKFEMMCMLYMIANGTALLSGQFCLTLHFYKQDFKKEPTEAFSNAVLRGLVVFYSFLVLLKGCSEMAIAVLMREASVPVTTAAPFFVSRRDLVLADGVFTMLLGLYGIVVGAAGLFQQKALFVVLHIFSFVFQLALYDLAQYGDFPVGVLSTQLLKFSLKLQGVETACWTAAVLLIPAYFAAMMDDPSVL